MRPRTAHLGPALCASLGLFAWGLLFWNAAHRRADWDVANPGHSRRYWEDLAVAAVNHQLGAGYAFDGLPYGRMGTRVAGKLQALLPVAVRRAGVEPWQFWRTVGLRRFAHVAPLRLRDEDDQGRAWLSRLGFDLLGGVAPYLPLWLGVLLVLPLFVWIGLECGVQRAGMAAVFLSAVASSCHVAELLTLPYSTAGYHVAGLLVVVVLFVHALLGSPPTLTGLVARWAVAGVFLAALSIGRGTVRALAPALAPVALIAAWRAFGRGARAPLWPRAGGAALALLLAAGPYLALRPPFEHPFWMAAWQGLGDFDREKGFIWDDTAARRAVRREGYVFGRHVEPISDPEMEAIFKRLVLGAVREDPAWYAGILARRATATVLQLRLWPREAEDGTSHALAVHPNEGRIDYYNFTCTADWFGFGGRRRECPLALLWLPPLAAIAMAAWPRVRPLVSRAEAGVVAVVAVAAATTPVLVTTASAPETQAFLLVYLLSAGVVAQALWRRRPRARGPAAAIGGTPAPPARIL